MINNIYLILNLITFVSTLALSFHKDLRFYTRFKYVFFSIFIVGFIFLVWDYFFVRIGVWGFNQAYLVGLNIANLPIEEIMFFITVPFALLFCYQLILKYKIGKSIKINHLKLIPALLLVLLSTLIVSINVYPLFVSFLTIVVLIFSYRNIETTRYYWVTYLVTLVPFFVFNTILTRGMLFVSNDPVVWYNPESITNLRIGTIPIEDFFYQFVLLFLLIYIFERSREKL